MNSTHESGRVTPDADARPTDSTRDASFEVVDRTSHQHDWAVCEEGYDTDYEPATAGGHVEQCVTCARYRTVDGDTPPPARTPDAPRDRKAAKEAARTVQALTGLPYQQCKQAVEAGTVAALASTVAAVADQIARDHLTLDQPAQAGSVAVLLRDVFGWDVSWSVSHTISRVNLVIGGDSDAEVHANNWSRAVAYAADRTRVAIDLGVPSDCPNPMRVAAAIDTVYRPTGGDVHTVTADHAVLERLRESIPTVGLFASWADSNVAMVVADTIVFDLDADDERDFDFAALLAAVDGVAQDTLCAVVATDDGVDWNLGYSTTVRFIAG